MWERAAERRLRALWRQFPTVLIVGARQVGKTTLARMAFPGLPYFDLEEPGLRQLFTEDPVFQLENRTRNGAILDEAQAVPEVFAALRGIIDARRRLTGRFLILGSAQPSLIRRVSESLAGRVGVLDLDPLTVAETQSGKRPTDWRRAWLHGGFPDALRGDFRQWWEAYLRTYVERDLPHLGMQIDSLFFRRLMTMIAHAQGGLLNASQLGNSLGVSYHTVQRHLDILEQTFLVRRLPPYYRNIGKRLTKSPKVYLRDTGLLHHLLNINSLDELTNHPGYGASWETFVLEEIARRERLRHPHTQFSFWRTAAGNEVDLVLDRGSKRIAIEVKVGKSYKPEIIRKLVEATADIDAAQTWVIDQAPGIEPLQSGIRRRGFAVNYGWLP